MLLFSVFVYNVTSFLYYLTLTNANTHTPIFVFLFSFDSIFSLWKSFVCDNLLTLFQLIIFVIWINWLQISFVNLLFLNRTNFGRVFEQKTLKNNVIFFASYFLRFEGTHKKNFGWHHRSFIYMRNNCRTFGNRNWITLFSTPDCVILTPIFNMSTSCDIYSLPTKDFVIYCFGWFAIIFLGFVITFILGLALYNLFRKSVEFFF